MLRWHALVESVTVEFPDFKLVWKRDSTFMKAIDLGLRILTFGQMRQFMTSFITTIGTTMYVHSGWDTLTESEKMIVLRHERVHMRQSKRYGFLLFSFLYLFFPLPLFLSYFRAKFEKEAYEETLRAVRDYVPNWALVIQLPTFRESILKHFTTAEYAWMWPFRKSLERWYDGAVAELLRQYRAVLTEDTPRY